MIVKMKKLELIGLIQDRDDIITGLMKMGVVDVSNIQELSTQDQWKELVAADGSDSQTAAIESELEKLSFSINYLEKYDTEKKPLFGGKRELSREQYQNVVDNKDKVWSVVEQIREYDQRISYLKSEENRLNNQAATLKPWENLDIPLELTGTKSTTVLLGTIPSMSDLNQLETDFNNQQILCNVKKISSDKDQSYLSIIYHNQSEESVLKILKQYNFSKTSFKEYTGVAKENIANAYKQILDIHAEKQSIEQFISALSDQKKNIEVLYDHLSVHRDKQKIISNLVKTDSVFMLHGWAPENNIVEVRTKITQQFDCVIEIKDAKEDEQFPVLLKNNSFVKPFELITELYSLPNSKEVDPNTIMAPFYVIFFGLMVSDAGYGIVLALTTFIMMKKFKLEGIIQKLVKLMFWGGISTFVWGAFFGGWFGDLADTLVLLATGTRPAKAVIPPLIFNPMEDPMRLLVWSFIMGGIHLFAGMGMKAYSLIREGKVTDAIFDIGFWYVLLIGVVLFGVGSSPVMTEVGKWMSLGGALGLLLTQGRHEKNIIFKFTSGLSSLYGITGYLSDVLSYSRLLALGLATGVIATVVNTMGSLMGNSIFGIIVFIIVFIGGHVFNILINALGAYVHSSRLQYVEFFGKFYEGGGTAFKPFKIATKYINIKNKEAI